MNLMLQRLRFINGYEDADSSEAELNFDEDTETESDSDIDDSGVEDENSGPMDEGTDETGTNDESMSEESSTITEDQPVGEVDDLKEQIPKPKLDRKAVKASIRDKLIFREINNDKLCEILPRSCKIIFEDPDVLHDFKVEIRPDEGYWLGGKFIFTINVTEDYNYEPPKVRCLTKIWHPNITEEGAVCLSILRSAGIDEHCWSPARQLKDVILGINSLFTDLLNFHDPLNTQAAEMYEKNPREFVDKVKYYIRYYARS